MKCNSCNEEMKMNYQLKIHRASLFASVSEMRQDRVLHGILNSEFYSKTRKRVKKVRTRKTDAHLAVSISLNSRSNFIRKRKYLLGRATRAPIPLPVGDFYFFKKSQ